MKVLILVLMLTACSRHADLVKDQVAVKIENAKMDITHPNLTEWRVGKHKEVELTQSFTFIIDLPKLSDDDLEYLIDQKDTNAWILRLIQIKGSEQMDLGSMYTLYRPKKITRVSAAGPAGSVTIRVYYAAAFASERFRHLQCPMFEHDKKITDLEVEGSNDPIEIPIGYVSSYQEMPQLIEVTPSSFNGGNALTGTYHVEIAAYNFTKKELRSKFIRASRHIRVVEEKSMDMQSCRGMRPDLTN